MEARKVFDMTCQEFWNSMPELAGSASPPGHVRECAACSAVWERHRSLMAGLRTVASESSGLQAPARVETRLTTAFRAHSGLAADPQNGRAASFWVPVFAWTAAAAGLVVLALLLVTPRRPATARHIPVELASAQAVVDSDSLSGDEGFIRLPNAESLAPNEDINLVRVEVPRATMIDLGFAVSAERALEPVEAEVLLGADGLARAVRFLDE